ncbi:hypothetical protein QWM81_06685 [Streptomyces ficellus]|uniref:Gram-positive cocci surface proteins LPxTG domain-containing protein n=1 Tax=Streptomyces ficellus TaxID=1977088 RepID=A0ABT7Z2L3_9ACTN|nr:hypothetical protein [Streptomyces ficellus]MDN3293735.1 hypothetical protein [Streptomyces ficellus]
MRLRHVTALAATATAAATVFTLSPAVGLAPAHASAGAQAQLHAPARHERAAQRDSAAADPGGFGVAVPDRQPTCGDPSAAEFPIRTRISGGPDAYRPGGGFHAWQVELTNTTSEPCGNIHPVIVFTDRTRALRPAQIQLEFYEGAGSGRHYPVTVEKTDESEIVGVLDDIAGGFPGFTVPPGRTVTVPVRLAFTSDARPDTITANAAIVQRRGDDGDWVGASADYRFTLVDDEPASETAEELPSTGRNVLLVAGASAIAFLLGAGTLSLAGRLRDRNS